MIRLILISFILISLGACTTMQHTAYSDDLYYVPEKEQVTVTDEDQGEESQAIVENKDELKHKNAESYDGFAESYQEPAGERNNDYVVMDYSSRLQRFHDVYVYDPYYYRDPWYDHHYSYYGSPFYPHVGIGYNHWNSRWRLHLGWSTNWYYPYGTYPYYGGYYAGWYTPGNYWWGFHDGYYAGYYNSYYGSSGSPITEYTDRRRGYNRYSGYSSSTPGSSGKVRKTADSRGVGTKEIVHKKVRPSDKKLDQRETTQSSSLTRLGSSTESNNREVADKRQVQTSGLAREKEEIRLTRPAGESNNRSVNASRNSNDLNFERNQSLIRNNRTLQLNDRQKRNIRTTNSSPHIRRSGTNSRSNVNSGRTRTIRSGNHNATHQNRNSRVIRNNSNNRSNYNRTRSNSSSRSSVRSSSSKSSNVSRSSSSSSSSSSRSSSSGSPRRR